MSNRDKTEKTKAQKVRELKQKTADELQYFKAFESFYSALKHKRDKTSLENALQGLAKEVWKAEVKKMKTMKSTLKKSLDEYKAVRDIDIQAVKIRYLDRDIDLDSAKERGGGKVLLLKRLKDAQATMPNTSPKKWCKIEKTRILAELPVRYSELSRSEQRYVRKQFHYVDELASLVVG